MTFISAYNPLPDPPKSEDGEKFLLAGHYDGLLKQSVYRYRTAWDDRYTFVVTKNPGRSMDTRYINDLKVLWQDNQWPADGSESTGGRIAAFIYSRSKEDAHSQLMDFMGITVNGLEHGSDLLQQRTLYKNNVASHCLTTNSVFDMVHLGLKWGIKSNSMTVTEVRDHTYGSHHWRSTLQKYIAWYHFRKWKNESGSRRMQNDNYYVNTWQWNDGAELKCIQHIHNGLKELLLEHLWDLFEHHNLHAEMHGLVTDEFLASKIQDEQKLSAHKTFRNNLLSSYSSQRQDIAYQIQNLWKELDSQFVSATDLKKALAVCSKYVEGKLGVDWFIHDMFDEVWQKKQIQQMKDYFNQAHLEKTKGYSGITTSHINNDMLKPLFKAHPDVARLYS